MSPLTSSAGDEQTVTRIERKKKGQRLAFYSRGPGKILVMDTSGSPRMVPSPTEIVIRRKVSQKLPSRDSSPAISILGIDWEGGESGVG